MQCVSILEKNHLATQLSGQEWNPILNKVLIPGLNMNLAVTREI